MSSVFEGAITALVTPFSADGSVDETELAALVERQIEAGISALVPCGTTGEAPTLSYDEHARVIEVTVQAAKSRIPIMAGIGSNDTQAAIANGRRAKAAGAQGLLATAPYYNKPTQEGLYRHFRAIAESTDLEVVLYNVPGRSIVSIAPETIARLSRVPNITAVKEASGDMGVASEILRLVGPDFTLLSGDDFTTLPFLALGGHGCVSVATNVVPKAMVDMVSAARGGDLPAARTIHLSLYPLFKALFLQSNPLPVKAALAAMGLIEARYRLPLCEMDPAPLAALHAELRAQGLIGA